MTVLALLSGGGYGVYNVMSRDDSGEKGKDSHARIADALFAPQGNEREDGIHQSVRSVGSTGSTVVAAGTEIGGIVHRAQFLISLDGGRSWQAGTVKGENDNESVGGSPEVVTGSSAGWLALGRTGDRTDVWRSTDGRTWTQSSVQANAFTPSDRIEQITRTPSGFFAVGYKADPKKKVDTPLAWSSPDGRSWQRLEAGKLKLPVKSATPVRLSSVASIGQIITVAGDTLKRKGRDTVSAIWTSADGGRTWEYVQPPSSDGAFGRTFIAASPREFAVLREGKKGKDRYGLVYRSSDAKEWLPWGRTASSGGKDINFRKFTGNEQGFAALADAANGAVVFRSDNGTTWKPAVDLGTNSRRTIQGIAVTAGSAVVGGIRSHADSDYYLSVVTDAGRGSDVDLDRVPGAVHQDRAVRDVFASNDRIAAVGSSNGSAAVWTSKDGAAWNRADTTGLRGNGRQTLRKVIHGPQGWLAVGNEGGLPLVATSSDGQTWQRVQSKAFTASKNRIFTLNAAGYGGKGYVIVGSDSEQFSRSAGAVWYSKDLQAWKRAESGDLNYQKGRWRTLNSVAATPNGYVAVGTVGNPSARPAVWSSQDGMIWKMQTIPVPGGFSSANLSHIAARNTTLAALGSAGTPSGPTHTLSVVSDDSGTTWRIATLTSPSGQSSAPDAPTSLTTSAKGFAAAGTLGKPGNQDVVLWTSTNGHAWRASTPAGDGLSGRGSQQILGLTTSGNRLLGVGITADERTEHTTLWRPTG